MSLLIRCSLGALAIACAASACAQAVSPVADPSAPKTRAQVKQEFLAWRAAGYDPNDWLNYPDNAMRAGQIVAQQQSQMQLQMRGQSMQQ